MTFIRINLESMRNDKAGAIFTGTRGQYSTSSKHLSKSIINDGKQ